MEAWNHKKLHNISPSCYSSFNDTQSCKIYCQISFIIDTRFTRKRNGESREIGLVTLRTHLAWINSFATLVFSLRTQECPGWCKKPGQMGSRLEEARGLSWFRVCRASMTCPRGDSSPCFCFPRQAASRHAFNATPPHFAMRRLLAQHAPIAARMIHVKTTRGAPLVLAL